jgi:hypothetical protein
VEWSKKLDTCCEVAVRFGTEDPRNGIVALGIAVTYGLDQECATRCRRELRRHLRPRVGSIRS